MANYEFFVTSSLSKVFPDERPVELKNTLYSFKNEKVSVQLCYYLEGNSEVYPPKSFSVKIENFDGKVVMRDVNLIASEFPCTENHDHFYLKTTPGLYPDLLSDNQNGVIRPLPTQYKSLWIDLIPEYCGAQDISIKINEVGNEYYNGKPLPETLLDFSLGFKLNVLNKELPSFDLIHTEWFHADCLADYYSVPVWSDKHWTIVENFINTASSECNINAILTPIFTQPLDTQVGGERTTVQLCQISCDNGKYSFDFSLLEKWCGICKKHGIKYLEIAHLFTQWGAEKTPKIFVKENGKLIKKFGWHIDATDVLYKEFLTAFLPALIEALKEFGYDKEHLLFHVSDEPTEEQIDSYLKAKNIVKPLLEGCTIVDALSSFEFYKNGVIEHPIPANDHIQPFIENKVKDLWVYYCVGQGSLVPNRFFAMPSARNRIMGVLMYLYNIKGFLHWGYNFYNSAYSITHINPYLDSSSHCSFPSGDPFLVYPKADGTAALSLRAECQNEGFNDMRALKALEEKIGRDECIKLVDNLVGYHMTFKHYPRGNEFFIKLRELINTEMGK